MTTKRHSMVGGLIKTIRQSTMGDKNLIRQTMQEEDLGKPNYLMKNTGEVKCIHANDFCDDPQLFISDGKRRIVSPGNPRFANAALCLLLRDQLWNKVVPESELQSQQWGNETKSKGMVRFRIWKFDQWVDVFVNDELPTLNKNHVLTHFESHHNELWMPMLEKALAKNYGDYDKMHTVTIEEFFEDLTGGICERGSLSAINEKQQEANANKWFSTLDDELCLSSVITCGNFNSETILPSGLNHKRLYAITSVSDLSSKESTSKCTKLVCLRTLWGDNSDWIGPMSKNSSEWTSLSDETRKLLEHGHQKDDFWMPIHDMCLNFDTVYICRMATNIADERIPQWYEKVGISKWPWKGKEKYQGLSDPQFIFDVSRESVDDEEEEVVIHVTRKNGGMIISTESGIDMVLYLVERNREIRMSDLSIQKALESTNLLSHRRSNSIRTYLRGGRYAVVPEIKGSFEPKDDLIVRVFTRGNYFFKELTKEVFKTKVNCGPVCMQKKHAKMATRVTLMSAVDMKRCDDLPADTRFYCVMSCEEQMVKTREVTFPTFREFGLLWGDESVMFYRYKPEKKFVQFDFYSDSHSKVGNYTHKTSKDTSVSEHEVLLEENLGKMTFKIIDIMPLANGDLLA